MPLSTSRTFSAAVLMLLAAAAMLLFVFGCAIQRPPSGADDPITRIAAENFTARDALRHADPLLNPIAAVHIGYAKGALERQVTDYSDAAKQRNGLQSSIDAKDKAYAKLDGKWYVTWGRRIERAVIGALIVTGIAIALRIFGLFAGGGFFGGIGTVVGHALNLIPYWNYADAGLSRAIVGKRKGR